MDSSRFTIVKNVMNRAVLAVLFLTAILLLPACGLSENNVSSDLYDTVDHEPWESDGKPHAFQFEEVTKNTPYREVLVDQVKEISYLTVFVLEENLRHFEQEKVWLGNYDYSELNENGLGPFSFDILERGTDGRYIISHITGDNDGESLNLKYWSIRDFDTGLYYFNYPMEDEDLYDYDTLKLISPKGNDKTVLELLRQDLKPKYGEIIDSITVDEEILTIKVRIDPGTDPSDVLSESLENLYDFIQNQYCFRYSIINYFVFAAGDQGTYQTVLSFDVNKAGIQSIERMEKFHEIGVRRNIQNIWKFDAFFDDELST